MVTTNVVVVLAAGLGTRLNSLFGFSPSHSVPFEGIPLHSVEGLFLLLMIP